MQNLSEKIEGAPRLDGDSLGGVVDVAAAEHCKANHACALCEVCNLNGA